MYSQILPATHLCSLYPHFETAFRHCPANYAIKPRTPMTLHRISFTVNRRPPSTIIRSGSRNLFDVADNNEEDGPIELPDGLNPFEAPEATPLQIAASVVLTGSIAALLYRSFKRRAKRAKEVRFRSSGADSVRKEAKTEALKALKKLSSGAAVDRPPPSAFQALAGAIIAGVIAFLLYNFSVSVESSLNTQIVSTNYSVRQITITIRTVVNGLCYLATCIFAVNSIGLTLYSGQLALKYWVNILAGQTDSTPEETENKMDVGVKDDNQ